VDSVDDTKTVDPVLLVEFVEYFMGVLLIIDFKDEGVEDGLKGFVSVLFSARGDGFV